MLRAMRVVLLLVITVLVGCSKEEARTRPAPVKAPVTAGTTGTDGVRRIPVEASRKGYQPGEIAAKPNEKLVLVFTRTVEGDCLSKVKVADGPAVDLPMNTPVDVPVTMPATGKLTFVCGMDMFTGTLAVTGT
jgi:plastocyanin domain-containing protein